MAYKPHYSRAAERTGKSTAAKKPEGKPANDFDSLEKAINDAASKTSALWLSFITFATLILITTGTVTHKKLFLEEPLKLPVLNADLDLISYFVFAPLFFLVFHFYLLLQLDGLVAKVRIYDDELCKKQEDASKRRLLRQRLDTFIFAQLLVGTREHRTGLIERLNRFVAWITVVGLPLFTMVLIQLIFLPYHGQAVTWWHRLAIVLDLTLIWLFWPRLPDGTATWRDGLRGVRACRRYARPLANAYVAAIVGDTFREHPDAKRARSKLWWTSLQTARPGTWPTLTLVLFSTLVAAYPTEWIYNSSFRPAPFRTLTRGLLQQGDAFDVETGKTKFVGSLFDMGSNRLRLSDVDFDIGARLKKIKEEYEKAGNGVSREFAPPDPPINRIYRSRFLVCLAGTCRPPTLRLGRR